MQVKSIIDLVLVKKGMMHYVHVMFELRNEEGMYKKLIVNHLREDLKKFAEFFRLSLEQFDFLVELIKDDMSKKSWGVKLYPITPKEKLAITLR